MSSLLVLGAGEEQVSIYTEARRRCLTTIAVDMRADRPGITMADEFLHMSTTDHAGIADALAGRDIAGVVSTAADTCLASWHHLSSHFRTPWLYPAAAARASMDKAEFHRVAAAAGIQTYRWVQSADLASLAHHAVEIGFPVVVKPTDASGCRGVTQVDTAHDLEFALEHAAANSASGQVVVEEYLPGTGLTVNVFLRDGEIGFWLITEKQILPGPNFLIGGHIGPARLPAALTESLLADARRLCLAFDLTDGPANFDAIVDDSGNRFFLEVGARMSGNGFPQLVQTATGVDCVAALVDLAIGRPVRLSATRSQPTQLHVIGSPVELPGELVAVDGLAEVAGMSGVTAVDVFARPGDTVQPFTESGHKLGWVVVTAADHDQLAPTLDKAVGALRITIG